MKATKALWVFLGTVAIIVGSALLFIQSKFFANILKTFAQANIPREFGVQAEFDELQIKFLPPGVVIKNPKIVLEEKNIAKLPKGTNLDSEYIDVTFQFFQLLTGVVTINAFEIHGANLKLDLEDTYFQPEVKEKKKSKKKSFFSLEDLVKFSFRSVSLVDSNLDLTIRQKSKNKKFQVNAIAKEVTIGKIKSDGKPAYDLAVDFENAQFDLPGFKRKVSQFRTSVELSFTKLHVRHFGVQDEKLSFNANGKLLGNFLDPKQIKSDLNYIVRGPIEDWLGKDLGGKLFKLPKNLKMKGVVTVDGKLKADMLRFVETLETKARIETDQFDAAGWKIDKSLLIGSWESEILSLESGTFNFEDGTVKVGAIKYDTKAELSSLQTKIKLDNVNFRRIMGPEIKAVFPLRMHLNGELDVNAGISKDDFNLDAQTKLLVKNFSFDNQKYNVRKPRKVLLDIEEMSLDSKFKVNEKGFFLEEAIAKLSNSTLIAKGDVTGARGFHLDINGDVDLADIGKLANTEIRGKGKLHWAIKGIKPNVIFTFDTSGLKGARYLNLNLGVVNGRVVYDDGKEFLYFKNLYAQQGRTEYIANGWVDIGDTDKIDVKVKVKKGSINDFTVVFADLLKRTVPWYPYDLTGQMRGTIALTGKTDLKELSVLGDMNLENLDYGYETFRGGKVYGGYKRGGYIAKNISMRKKTGWIKGDIEYSAKDVLSFNLRTEGMSTLDIDRLGILDIPYRAPLNISTRGKGKLESLDGSFNLVLGAGTIRNRVVPPSKLDLSTKKGRLQGDLSVFNGGASGKLDWGWAKGSNSRVSLRANGFDFSPILVGLNPNLATDVNLHSELSGNADLKFKTGRLSRLTGNINFDSYLLRRSGFELKLDRSLRLSLNDGSYNFDPVTFIGTGTQVVVEGEVKNQKIDYSFDGDLNLGIFEFFTNEIAMSKGTAKIKAKLFGKADEPNARGDITVKNSDLRLRSIEQTFEGLSYNVLWEDSFLYVSDMTSKFAGGKVSGKGVVELFYYKVPNLNFDFYLNNPKVKVYPVAYARTNGKLRVAGNKLPYDVTGRLVIPEALIRENFDLNERSRMLRSSKFLPKKGLGGVSGIQLFNLNVDVSADRGMLVRNDLFDSELRGKIKIINSVKAPRVLGNVEVLKGKLLFKDSFFTIQSGTLKFNNPSAIDPEVNMVCQTEVKGYKIVLVASGKVSDYKLSFQSQPPLSQKDIVNLLTIGVTSSDYQSIAKQNRDAYSRDEVYNLLFSQSGIHKGIREKTGINVRIGQSGDSATESAFSAKDPNTATTVSPKVEVQKEIVKDLSVSAGHTVGGVGGTTKERNLGIEVKLPLKKVPVLKDTSVIGVYEDQTGLQQKKTRESMGLDLKFRKRFKLKKKKKKKD